MRKFGIRNAEFGIVTGAFGNARVALHTLEL